MLKKLFLIITSFCPLMGMNRLNFKRTTPKSTNTSVNLTKSISLIKTNYKTTKNNMFFNCEYCNKSYRTKNFLQIHREVAHKNTQLYTAEIIQNYLVKQTIPKIPIIKHNVPTPNPISVRFNCEHCDNSYISKKNLQRHKKNKHSELVEINITSPEQLKQIYNHMKELNIKIITSNK